MGHRGTASAKAALYSRITILSSRWQRSCAVVVCSQLTVAMRGYGGERMHALHVCMHASRAADYGYSMMTTMCAHQPITGGVAIGCARKGNRRKAGRGVWEGLVMPVCPCPSERPRNGGWREFASTGFWPPCRTSATSGAHAARKAGQLLRGIGYSQLRRHTHADTRGLSQAGERYLTGERRIHNSMSEGSTTERCAGGLGARVIEGKADAHTARIRVVADVLLLSVLHAPYAQITSALCVFAG
jgi:hypothetical protein